MSFMDDLKRWAKGEDEEDEEEELDTPELDGTTLASSGKQPYTPVSLVVDSPGFDRLIVNGAQIFTGTQTVQDMMLLPTPSLPESYSRTETVTIPAQTL